MEIRELAKLLLYSPRIEDKLWAPERVTDEAPGEPDEIPTAPARPRRLKFAEGRAPFPSPEALASREARGRVLHFFANHELLATELMALMLLRFPRAPSKFRRGLVQTIREEQKHLRLYRSRMEELGVGLGEVPVNDFFWKHIAPVQRPVDFVARMSLTFEQANLDYSLHFARVFESIEDKATAKIMYEVFEDEIGHVKLGLHWFRRWNDTSHGEWEAYRSMLELPFSPSRAKGPIFDRESRRRAGLTEDFINRLEVYSHSKGRPPRVHHFNPTCEAEIAGGGAYTPSNAVRALSRDLAFVMVFVAKRDDVVLLPEEPDVEHLAQLSRAGFELPEIVACHVPRSVNLGDRVLGEFVPWGWSPTAEREAPAGTRPPRGHRRWFEKSWSARLLRELIKAGVADVPLSIVGQVVEDDEHVDHVVARLIDEGWGEVLVKSPLSAAGRDRLTLSSPPTQNERAWMSKTIQRTGCVVVEPRLQRALDLGVQLDGPEPLSIRRFFTDRNGRYLGHALARPFDDLENNARRALLQTGGLLDQLRRVARAVRERLISEGHVGPAGLDAMIYTNGGRWHLKPIVEINPRYTMGHVAAELERRIAPGRAGLWLHVAPNALPSELPPIQLTGEATKTRIDSGAMLTAPIDIRTRVAMALSVADNLEIAASQLGTDLTALTDS